MTGAQWWRNAMDAICRGGGRVLVHCGHAGQAGGISAALWARARYVKCGVMIHITEGVAVAARHTRHHSQQGG